MFLFSLPKLKSRPAVVAAAALLLFPLSAPPAAAWESACAEFQFPKVWFDGKFRVLYGFDDIPPTHGVVDGRHKLIPDPPYNRLTGRATRADDYHLPPGHIARGAGAWSGTMRTGNKRCVSLAEVRPGEKFVVYMLPGTMPESAGVFCGTHPDNPDRYYHQQDRPFTRIWWRVWGTTDRPRCEFYHETN